MLACKVFVSLSILVSASFLFSRPHFTACLTSVTYGQHVGNIRCVFGGQQRQSADFVDEEAEGKKENFDQLDHARFTLNGLPHLTDRGCCTKAHTYCLTSKTQWDTEAEKRERKRERTRDDRPRSVSCSLDSSPLSSPCVAAFASLQQLPCGKQRHSLCLVLLTKGAWWPSLRFSCAKGQPHARLSQAALTTALWSAHTLSSARLSHTCTHDILEKRTLTTRKCSLLSSYERKSRASAGIRLQPTLAPPPRPPARNAQAPPSTAQQSHAYQTTSVARPHTLVVTHHLPLTPTPTSLHSHAQAADAGAR